MFDWVLIRLWNRLFICLQGKVTVGDEDTYQIINLPLAWTWFLQGLEVTSWYPFAALPCLFITNLLNKLFYCSTTNFGHYRGHGLTHLMLIRAVIQFWQEDHREPHNEDGSLSPAEQLEGFKPGTIGFYHKTLTH